MIKNACVLMTAVLVLAASCTGVSYKDCSAPVEKRVEDLLSRMTLEEKVGQMNQFVGLDMMEQTKAKKLSRMEMMQGDEFAYYPGYPTDTIMSMIKSGLVGSFLHVQTLKEAVVLMEPYLELKDDAHRVESDGLGKRDLALRRLKMLFKIVLLPHVDAVGTVRGHKVTASDPRAAVVPLPRSFL